MKGQQSTLESSTLQEQNIPQDIHDTLSDGLRAGMFFSIRFTNVYVKRIFCIVWYINQIKIEEYGKFALAHLKDSDFVKINSNVRDSAQCLELLKKIEK